MKTMRERALLGLAAAAGLAGCADIRRATTLPPVNPESPVAAVVERGTYQRIPAPNFLDVPPAPKNMPTPVQVKLAVIDMVHCRRALVAWAPAHPPMVSDLTAFAASQRAQVDTNPADVPTAADVTRMQAYASQLRDYAAPPAPIESGPPPTAAEAAPPATVAAAPAPPKAVHKPAPAPHQPHPAHASAQMAAQAAAPGPASTPPPPPVDVQAGVIAIAPPLPRPLGDPLLNHCQ